MKRQTRARAAYAAATVLAVDAAAHLYWTTGAIWPAPDVTTLSMAVLNMEVPFTPRVLLPLAAALLTASAALITTTRLGDLGAGASGAARVDPSVEDRSVAASGDGSGAAVRPVGSRHGGAESAHGINEERGVADVGAGDGGFGDTADRRIGSRRDGTESDRGDSGSGGVGADGLAGAALSGARVSGAAVRRMGGRRRGTEGDRGVGSRFGAADSGGGIGGVAAAGTGGGGTGGGVEVGRVGARRMPGPLVARVVRLVTGVVALGVLARAVLGLVWTLGFGVQTSTPFYWLNALLYTPLCLALFMAVVVARGTAAPADGPARDHGVKIS
ncbi:DUF3995 domain-containing protein [Nonomuraea dietziae]|uniref:DUF3995 domain-containing protein n=1 Tax=Nonomuraea dietziae TaxID=65515 RepID=UPI003446C908